MNFLVTNNYEIIDCDNGFETLSLEDQSDLLYDALDLYEKHAGRAEQSNFPEVVAKREDSTILGTISV